MNRIDFNTLKEILPFGILLVSIALAWGSLMTQLALLNQKTDVIVQQGQKTETQISQISSRQQDLDRQITRIATIIEEAQRRGLLTQAAQPQDNEILTMAAPNIAAITPTPGPTPAQQTTVIVNPPPAQPTPTKTPVPTPTPTPRPQILPGTSLCVIGLCLGKL